ncbi:MAG: DUF4232 domain-containing protein [Catenulisporales bacterium]|jgi:hypothetical protein|nr:DUF4232 domain-containing protein [Catenulisporales bacterium]
MNRISVLAVSGLIGAAALTAGCSSSASKAPAATGSTTSAVSSTPASSSSSSSQGAVGPASSSSASPPTRSSSTASSAPSTAPSSSASSHGNRCTAGEMPAGTWKVVAGSEGAGHVAADISLRNTSTHSCTVAGYPAISMLASDQHPLPTNVVRFPTAVTTVTVAPGAWIHSEVRYSPNIPGPGEPQTGECEPMTVHALAQLPGDTAWAKVTLPTPTAVCEKGTLEAKPFASGQASPSGG